MKFKKIKTNKRIKNKTNMYLFYLFTVIVISLSVGYSAINSDVSISGEASFRVLKDLRITDVRLYETTFNGEERYNSKFTKDSITLGVDLKETQSTVTYLIEVTNYGTVAMTVDSIKEGSNSNINATTELIGYNKTDLINPGESRNIYVKIKYKDNVTTLPTITTVDLILGFEYVTPESTLAMGNGNAATSTFFNSGPIKKGEVESIEFLPTLEVGDNALGYWDASYKKDNTVIAWYTDTDSDNLYELYIGGNGKVYAYSDAKSLFHNFNKVESIEFGEYFDTSNVVNMGAMFQNCSLLKMLDISTFDTSNVTSYYRPSYGGFLQGCSSLETLDLGDNFNTSNVTSLAGMFQGCSKLTSIDVTKFDTSNVTTMAGMFRNCSSLMELDVSNFLTTNVTNMERIFENCSGLTELDVSNFNTNNVTSIAYMFLGCSKLTSLDVTNFNTTNVTNMTSMFRNCSSLTELDLSSFDTSKVTGMSNMFYNCSKLTELNVTNFVTSNVTNMSSMFWGCSKLTELDLTNFVTSNVTDMSNMFSRCSALNKVNLSTFDTSNVTSFGSYGMFSGCGKLTELDLSNFDTSKVIVFGSRYDGIFQNCTNLTKLDIRNFDFSSANNDTNFLFGNVPTSCEIIVKTDVERDYILNIRSDFTNIKTVAELPVTYNGIEKNLFFFLLKI